MSEREEAAATEEAEIEDYWDEESRQAWRIGEPVEAVAAKQIREAGAKLVEALNRGAEYGLEVQVDLEQLQPNDYENRVAKWPWQLDLSIQKVVDL